MHLSKYSEESPTCFWARGGERGAILKSVSVVINVDFNILQHLRTIRRDIVAMNVTKSNRGSIKNQQQIFINVCIYLVRMCWKNIKNSGRNIFDASHVGHYVPTIAASLPTSWARRARRSSQKPSHVYYTAAVATTTCAGRLPHHTSLMAPGP